MDERIILGKTIQEKRKLLKLSQKEFATQAGLGLRFVKELEEGKATVRLDKVNQALEFLGMTMEPVNIDYALRHENTPDTVIILEVINICHKYNATHLYLYGSYATGTQTRYSDFDFAVSGIKDNMNEMLIEIENIRTLKGIDVVDMDSISNKELKESILKNGRKIF